MKSFRRKTLLLFPILAVAARADLSVSSPTDEEVWRLDCGTNDAPAFPADTAAHLVDPNGNLWLRDEPFSASFRWGYAQGSTAQSDHSIGGTTLDSLYQTHRWGPTGMQYTVRLPNGLYRVNLHFAETTYASAGARVFDVALEDNVVLDDHDVFAHVGSDTADVHTFGVVVTDQQLDITFPEVKADNAMIAGIEVLAVDVSDDSLLDFLQKRMFYYFANHTSSSTGLTPVALSNWIPETYDEGGLAVSGLGMSVLAVAVSRGWTSAVEAVDRIRQTLSTIEGSSSRVRGFPYHRYVRDTGAVRSGAEVSSLESALFILGAIQAGNYFRDVDPTLFQRIEDLDDQMDWTWWLNRTRPGTDDPDKNSAIAKGWRSTSDDDFVIPSADPAGYFRADWWKDYSETLLVNLAAAGAPIDPVPATIYNSMGRPWARLYGEDILHAPALSQHQYPHLFFDLRSRPDSYGIDYFDMARRATLVNRRACLADPAGRFAANRWGLAGAFGPGDVYRMYGPEPNPAGVPDGTVDPNAALISLLFTPTESLAAVRHQFFQYKHHVLGRHGFCDGFNVSQNYRAPVADGLDLAAAILAIENFRTGMTWARFMESTHAQAAVAALGAGGGSLLYQASTAFQPPSFAFDDNTTTVWESADYDPQWLQVSLAGERSIGRVNLIWDKPLARRYKIQTSLDGSTWVTVVDQVGGGTVNETWDFRPVSARYVRFYGYERGGQEGYRLAEMSVLETSGFSLRAYPNPFRPSRGHQTVKVSGLTPNSELTITSISGPVVRRLTADDFGTAQWDGRDTSGRWVPSDVYTVNVEGQNDRIRLILQR